jgi:hypothetical protein
MAAEEANAQDRVLRHVVLFAFKPTATPDDIRRIEEAFAALPGKIDAILDFEWGTDVSVEGKANGFTHCFFVTFRDEAARAAYLPHPDHQAFGSLLRPHLEKSLVLDYFTSRPCGTQRREGDGEAER